MLSPPPAGGAFGAGASGAAAVTGGFFFFFRRFRFGGVEFAAGVTETSTSGAVNDFGGVPSMEAVWVPVVVAVG